MPNHERYERTPDKAIGLLAAKQTRPREGGASFGLRNRIVRVIWRAAWTLLAAWTPPMLHGWRRRLLRLFGADMAPGATVYGSARIWYPAHLTMGRYAVLGPRANCYNQARITIGDYAIVSQDASLCSGTHDHGDPDFQLIARPIVIGRDAWVAAEAFVGPGVTIGEGAVLGARGVAMRDLEPHIIYSGNPATALRERRVRPK